MTNQCPHLPHVSFPAAAQIGAAGMGVGAGVGGVGDDEDDPFWLTGRIPSLPDMGPGSTGGDGELQGEVTGEAGGSGEAAAGQVKLQEELTPSTKRKLQSLVNGTERSKRAVSEETTKVCLFQPPPPPPRLPWASSHVPLMHTAACADHLLLLLLLCFQSGRVRKKTLKAAEADEDNAK